MQFYFVRFILMGSIGVYIYIETLFLQVHHQQLQHILEGLKEM